MGASKGKAMPLTIVRFSVQAARSAQRLRMDVIEFFLPISELIRSISSQLSYGPISLDGGRKLDALALTRARFRRPSSRAGAGRTHIPETYEQRMLELPDVALLLHLNLGAKLPTGFQRATSKQRNPVQTSTVAPRKSLSQAPQDSRVLQTAWVAASGDTALEVPQISRGRGAHLEIPAMTALAGAIFPALALNRAARPIIGLNASGYPRSALGVRKVQAESTHAGIEGTSKQAAVVDASVAEGTYGAVMAGAILVLQLSNALAARVGESVYGPGHLNSKGIIRQPGTREGEGYAPHVARLSATKGTELGARSSSEVKMWAAFTPLIRALERANFALRRQVASELPIGSHSSALRGPSSAGKPPEGGALNKGYALSDALLAVMALQTTLSMSMPSFAAVQSAKSKQGQAHIASAGGRAALTTSSGSGAARTMPMEIEEPTFGDRLNGIPGLWAVGQQPCRAAVEDSAGEERALRALDRMRRPEGRIEPAFGGAAQQPSINIDVAADQDLDLRELERRIERILQEQVRRFYGMR